MAKNQELEDKESELNQLTMEIEKLSEFKTVIQAKHSRVSPDHVSYEELDDLRVSLGFLFYSRVPNKRVGNFVLFRIFSSPTSFILYYITVNKKKACRRILLFTKAELLQLNHIQFICLINFVNKKVGNRKN